MWANSSRLCLSMRTHAPPPRKRLGPCAARLLVSSCVVGTAQPRGPQCSRKSKTQRLAVLQGIAKQRRKLRSLTSSSISSVFPVIAQTVFVRACLFSNFKPDTILGPGTSVWDFQGGLREPPDPSLALLSTGSLQRSVAGLIVWSLEAGWLRIYRLEDTDK